MFSFSLFISLLFLFRPKAIIPSCMTNRFGGTVLNLLDRSQLMTLESQQTYIYMYICTYH